MIFFVVNQSNMLKMCEKIFFFHPFNPPFIHSFIKSKWHCPNQYLLFSWTKCTFYIYSFVFCIQNKKRIKFINSFFFLFFSFRFFYLGKFRNYNWITTWIAAAATSFDFLGQQKSWSFAKFIHQLSFHKVKIFCHYHYDYWIFFCFVSFLNESSFKININKFWNKILIILNTHGYYIQKFCLRKYSVCCNWFFSYTNCLSVCQFVFFFLSFGFCWCAHIDNFNYLFFS